MIIWLKSYWIFFCAILQAPILYHASRDGFVINAMHTYLEMVDAYGVLVLTFVFITSLVYYRNTLFRVFLYSLTLFTRTGRQNAKTDASSHLNKLANRNKFLSCIRSTYRFMKFSISPVYTKIKSFFQNK